jgi:CubicO group peptidase (beta-lactamase class C family)
MIPMVFLFFNKVKCVLSAVISRVSQKTTLEFAKEKLFNPLGITKYQWDTDKNGVHFGGYGLWMKPTDVAKIGYLYLCNGMWQGKQIVPENWVKESTTKKTGTYWPDNGAYGYLWWINSFGGYCTRGAFGQDMFVFPDKNLVVVFNSNFGIADAARRLNWLIRAKILTALK